MPDRTRPEEPGWPSDDHDGTRSLAEQDTLWVRRTEPQASQPVQQPKPQTSQPVQQLKPQGSLFQPEGEQPPQWPGAAQPSGPDPAEPDTLWVRGPGPQASPDRQGGGEPASWPPEPQRQPDQRGGRQGRSDQPPGGQPEYRNQQVQPGHPQGQPPQPQEQGQARPPQEQGQHGQQHQARRQEQAGRPYPQAPQHQPHQQGVQRPESPEQARQQGPHNQQQNQHQQQNQQQQPQQQNQQQQPVVPVVPAVVHAQPMRIEPSGEQHPASATTGADEPPAAPTEKEGGPRRKWPWIAAVLVVLLVLGGGGVAAVQPAVANRLELPWAPNKPRGEAPAAQQVYRQLQAPGPSAPSPTADGVEAALKESSGAAALGTLSGSVIDPATGTALWAKDADKPLTPASTTKVLTVAAALLAMDHGHQISTKVVQGADPGTAIVVAGGDPTINSLPAGKDSIYPGSAHLDDLVKQVKEASGGKIETVQLDLGVFQGSGIGPGWAPEDAPSTYAAAVEPVMLDGGRSSATDEKSMRVADPAKAFADKFASKLGASADGNAKAAEGAKVLGEIKSAPLTELISNVLNHSDNLMGDVLARQTAIATGEKPSFEGGSKATLEVLKKNGFHLDGVQLFDGSGLSVDNRIPAKVLAEVLAVAAAPDGSDPRTAKLRPLLGGLSVAGGSSGRLVSRYTSGPEEAGKGWVRAKTGTLSGVNTLAGVVLDKDGHLLVFALMSLGSESEGARSALDAVVAELRGCGCR